MGRSPFLRFYMQARGLAANASRSVPALLPGAGGTPAAMAAAAAAAADAREIWEDRSTLLFFHGSLCWQTHPPAGWRGHARSAGLAP